MFFFKLHLETIGTYLYKPGLVTIYYRSKYIPRPNHLIDQNFLQTGDENFVYVQNFTNLVSREIFEFV